MFVSKESLEKLKERILIAFDNVPYPQTSIAPHECDECRELREIFDKKDWRTINAKFLEENFGAMSLFSPEAFQYFLPAYLIGSLNNFSEKYDTVCKFTIYAVTPDNEDVKNRLDYWKNRFENFTSKQMNCIYDFLDFVAQDENFDSFTDEAETGKQNLQELIKPINEN